jgi:hypothetical protein
MLALFESDFTDSRFLLHEMELSRSLPVLLRSSRSVQLLGEEIMATIYRVTVTAVDGTDITITIVDSLNPIPGSDTWQVQDDSWFGKKTGTVASWGTGNAMLEVGPGNVTLDGFRKSTKLGDSGEGSKTTGEGKFPDGKLVWTCVAVS